MKLFCCFLKTHNYPLGSPPCSRECFWNETLLLLKKQNKTKRPDTPNNYSISSEIILPSSPNLPMGEVRLLAADLWVLLMLLDLPSK